MGAQVSAWGSLVRVSSTEEQVWGGETETLVWLCRGLGSLCAEAGRRQVLSCFGWRLGVITNKWIAEALGSAGPGGGMESEGQREGLEESGRVEQHSLGVV